MYKERVLKSELIKNIPVNVINQYKPRETREQDQPISVYERDGNYFVIDGLDTLLRMNGEGDSLVDCYVTHKESFL